MNTLEKMTADLTTSMKARDTFRTSTLRQIIGAVRTAEKSGKVSQDFTDDQVRQVVSAEVKKRRESAEIYTSVGAAERAANETAEADLLETYLPAALTAAQLDEIVADAIATTGATSARDMGKVMKAANVAAAGVGRVDGKILSGLVRKALGA